MGIPSSPSSAAVLGFFQGLRHWAKGSMSSVRFPWQGTKVDNGPVMRQSLTVHNVRCWLEVTKWRPAMRRGENGSAKLHQSKMAAGKLLSRNRSAKTPPLLPRPEPQITVVQGHKTTGAQGSALNRPCLPIRECEAPLILLPVAARRTVE